MRPLARSFHRFADFADGLSCQMTSSWPTLATLIFSGLFRFVCQRNHDGKAITR